MTLSKTAFILSIVALTMATYNAALYSHNLKNEQRKQSIREETYKPLPRGMTYREMWDQSVPYYGIRWKCPHCGSENIYFKDTEKDAFPALCTSCGERYVYKGTTILYYYFGGGG